MLTVGSRDFRPVHSALWDPNERLAAMDRDGIDVQLMCATPFLFAYQREAEPALGCAQLFNDVALEICSGGSRSPSQRLHALCQVPLQDTDLACRELTRAMRAGHVGVQIGNHVGPRDMDDDGIVTFLQHCADENAPVLVHPWDMMGADRTRNYMMGWDRRDAGRDAALDRVDDPRRRIRPVAAQPEDLFRARRRQLCVPARTARERMAQPRHRARQVAVSAVALLRPVSASTRPCSTRAHYGCSSR